MGNRLDIDALDLDPRLRFDLPCGGHALFTTRAEGNLSTMRGPGHERGRHERDRLCERLDLRWLCASPQVHGTAVQRVVSVAGSGGQPVELDVDGHATALHGVGMMVLVADCLPVVIGSEGAVAALHAGWRGLAGGVIEEGVRAMRELGGRGELVAVVGPGARGCCYEVGEELHGVFGNAYRDGRNLDLAAVARARLKAAGVTCVEDAGVCTICDERLFSHRREGLQAGRQAGIAWLGAHHERSDGPDALSWRRQPPPTMLGVPPARLRSRVSSGIHHLSTPIPPSPS